MQSVSILLFKSIIIAAIMLLYYMLVLRNKKLLTYNRYYLLATVLASVTIPFLHFGWYSVTPVGAPANIKILEMLSTGADEAVTIQAQTSSLSLDQIVLLVYVVISTVLFLVLVKNVAGVYRLKQQNKAARMTGYNLIYTELENAPFSFMNNIFWKSGIHLDSDAGQRILQHELTHVKQRHTIDKLFLQLVLVVCWINPLYWLIQKELSLTHEFLADEGAIKDNDTSAFAHMLLVSQYSNKLSTVVNPFFYSPIKRRIIMLTQTNKTKYSLLRKSMLFPLVLGSMFLFSFTIHKKEAPVYKANAIATLILDAGHGGYDMGATDNNGVSEKDLTLRICKKLAALASEYNVNVVQTRPEDISVPLMDRVKKANEVSDGIFVCIHVNKTHAEYTDANGVKGLGVEAKDGFEAFVWGKSPQLAASKMLASAMLQQLESTGRPTTLSEKGLIVLKGNKHPAIAIECGNVDNAADMAILSDEQKLEHMCRSMLSGVVVYANAK